ncbi:malto-oligosyltrehalose synthase [Rhodococcoides kyotonense]|uniref:(1->4)-alpha-D-glucan 1-alpha-D-glucosylmutase n=1 Tax=Rhodococcoides kyotonense TaxID=398843 RepID=A0A239KTX3_9NOCA|nr:malto-oligosyltrehalose synthase [Rhodococcus kyotonensis]SNT21806.1 (1->4)-alpha-D-glucan 1-alpha-D-glucosylmutase [Rhodococcus kyotonensis]
MPTPSSTYRLQLRGDGFTLEDARGIVDYLDDLGVTHAYLSPVLTATDGSTHGYDVVDPTSVSPALGGRSALDALAAELSSRGMGVVIDIVPNHVGVEDPRQNAWWWDVLTNGSASQYATFFDIDWAEDNGTDGKIALPILGSDADVDELTIDRTGDTPLLAYYEHRFPIATGTDDGDATTVHDRQAYRLVNWRSGLVGYRRFFSVNGLAGLRQEDYDVFTESHREIASWMTDGVVDGIRVDHPDGLADPAGYLTELRELMGPDRWLVIEKILARGEPLDTSLPVDGTTGYDALADVGGVFVDPAGAAALGELSLARTGIASDAAWLHDAEEASKTAVAQGDLKPEVRRLTRAILRESGTDASADSVTDAVVAVVAHMPYYRSDYAPLAGTLARVIGIVLQKKPELEAGLDAVTAALVADGESAVRFEQVCGAVTAKGVEDRLFYRATRLISLQEVGGDPSSFGVAPAQFHLANADRATHWPAAMTTLSTHDTKRGEDVRARIGVLSQTPELWARCIADWELLVPSPDGTTGLFLWQNLFGVWPVDGVLDEEFRGRIHAYAEKAIREANLRTGWNESDEKFETSVHDWLDGVMQGSVADSVTMLVARLDPHGRSDALGQKLLQLAGPGVPDVYQGTELWDDSLVDPDNRRPVDFAARRELLTHNDTPDSSTDAAAKFRVVRAALRERRERPGSFVGGTYAPVYARGSAPAHVVGFARGPAQGDPDVIALATRHSLTLESKGWGTTSVVLPQGQWRDRLTGTQFTGDVAATELFAALPVALLVRENVGDTDR